MSEETDDDFYGRADAHVHLSNDQRYRAAGGLAVFALAETISVVLLK